MRPLQPKSQSLSLDKVAKIEEWLTSEAARLVIDYLAGSAANMVAEFGNDVVDRPMEFVTNPKELTPLQVDNLRKASRLMIAVEVLSELQRNVSQGFPTVKEIKVSTYGQDNDELR